MFSRLCLQLSRCNIYVGISVNFNKITPCRISISGYNRFSKMSFSNESLSQKTFNTVYPPIYVLSRIKELSSTIRKLSDGISSELLVKDIQLPVDSDILSPSTLEELSDADIIVVDPKILAFNYKSLPKLKWAHCTWAGVEPLFEVMSEKPQFILTKHGDEEFSEQIAEYVMAQVLILQKNFRSIWAAQVERSWSEMQKCALDCVQSGSLKELTVGVLGVGNMGQAIAKFFKPHGTKVIGLSRRMRKTDEYGLFDKIVSSLADVLATSDYIVNTLPSTPETVGLLNGDVLKSCTKVPVFINIGRGNITSESTLLRALENNWLSHIVLDVFQEEPLPTDSKLWNFDKQVTITPHCAAISQPKHIARDFLSSLLCYQQRSPMRNVVDWEKGY